jgi:hypothetical protein
MFHLYEDCALACISFLSCSAQSLVTSLKFPFLDEEALEMDFLEM